MKYLVYIGAVLGAICLFFSFFVSGAPQQAALAAMACAFGVLPYVIYRVARDSDDLAERRKAHQDISGRLQELIDSHDKTKT